MQLSWWLALGALSVMAVAQEKPLADPSIFDYDKETAFDFREGAMKTREGVTVYDASFISPKGGRVPCYVVAPVKKGKYAGIVWQHGGGQNRQWFLPDAIDLARNGGAVSILLDAPFERSPDNLGPQAQDEARRAYDQLVQVAVDVRRAVDVLSARPDVDAERIGYVGLSFGAMMGATLSGFETRIKAYVLDSGMEGFARHYKESPVMAQMRASLGEARLGRMIDIVKPLDNIHYIGRATAPMLFQAGRFDVGVPEKHTYDFFAAAGTSQKELKWYDCGHFLNDPQAAADRSAWLKKQLKLK